VSNLLLACDGTAAISLANEDLNTLKLGPALKYLPHGPRTLEGRRLAELARAAGLGDSPDSTLEFGQTAIVLLGADEKNPLLADALRWQGSVLRDRGEPFAARPLYERSF
jgi:hypothetical protein